MKISSSILIKEKRLDPEFYVAEIAKNINQPKLSDIASIRVGSTPKKKSSGSIPFYRVESVKTFSLKKTSLHVSENSLQEKFLAKKGDILLTIKGRIGDIVIVTEDCFYNQDIACLSKIKIDTHLLFATIRSNFVQNQIKKYSTNQMHPYIRLSDLKKVTIPNISRDKELGSLVKKIFQIEAKIISQKSNINNIFKDKMLFKKNKNLYISELKYSGRLDAEYHSGKPSHSIKVKDLNEIKVKIGKYKKIFTKKGIPYIRSKDLNTEMIAPNLFVKNSEKNLTIKDEILITRVGNIKAYLINNEKIVPSDNFLRLRFQDNKISPQALAGFLNSSAGQKEIERHMQGSKQKRLNKESLMNINIPLLTNIDQIIISKKLHQISILRSTKQSYIEQIT